MMSEVGELESIADACYNIARIIHRRDQTGKKFTSQQVNDLQAMMALCEEALDKMFTIVDGQNEENNIDETMRVEKGINAMRDRLRTENVEAVNKHSYDYTLGTLFEDKEDANQFSLVYCRENARESRFKNKRGKICPYFACISILLTVSLLARIIAKMCMKYMC